MDSRKFLEKARNTHGYKYKYIDLPNKLTLKDYIEIEFDSIIYKQSVNKHLMGKCPEKTTPKRTTEQFIKESMDIWGDRFNYDQTIYNGSLNKVRLYDTHTHMYVEQIANSHLGGHVCKDINGSDFIKKSKSISDYRYDYTNTNYVNKTTKVSINCPEHGDFEVLPYNHLTYGEVCRYCLFTKFSKSVKRFCSKNNILINTQYKFDHFEQPFDFYIFSMRTVIEFTYDDSDVVKVNDSIKNEYCEDNYIDIIRIRYDQIDSINKILTNNLINKINF